jgi:methyl coenzyme M reductase alpha subunit
MSLQKQAELLQFLEKNSNIFVWSTSDPVGVSREVIEHKLQVNPHAMPKKQSAKIVGRRVYQRSKIPTVASKHSDGPQKEWKMVNVHIFH